LRSGPAGDLSTVGELRIQGKFPKFTSYDVESAGFRGSVSLLARANHRGIGRHVLAHGEATLHAAVAYLKKADRLATQSGRPAQIGKLMMVAPQRNCVAGDQQILSASAALRRDEQPDDNEPDDYLRHDCFSSMLCAFGCSPTCAVGDRSGQR
jgi:hypothetical protein